MKYLILFLLLLFAGCRDERPPAPSAEQNEQLNDAENMLNDMSANETR